MRWPIFICGGLGQAILARLSPSLPHHPATPPITAAGSEAFRQFPILPSKSNTNVGWVSAALNHPTINHPKADHYALDPNKLGSQRQLPRPFGHKTTLRFLGDKGPARGYGWQEFNLLRKAA